MEFIGVIPKDLAVGRLWPQIGALVAAALPYGRGEYTLADIHDGIARGEMFALGAVMGAEVEFVMTCTVSTFPRKRVLYVQYGAGRGGARAKEALIAAARTLGCDWVETRCRETVARLYRRAGFETGYQVCIFEVPA
ncbi:hypothetical protein [Thauera aromatica]|uniref:hypothetical protein n=1 Tax=Thauera aromatica TaxID=59405 RepID=UPI001FFD3C08|nr:hypothetical protein [Thauera aromatica]MCK2097660.1 hypothetical protein [Thauera aromatica]